MATISPSLTHTLNLCKQREQTSSPPDRLLIALSPITPTSIRITDPNNPNAPLDLPPPLLSFSLPPGISTGRREKTPASRAAAAAGRTITVSSATATLLLIARQTV